MNETKNNAIGGLLFILLILVLGIGGFFFTKEVISEKEPEKNSDTEVVVSDEHKIDKAQEFIYYTNELFISMEPDITYKDVTINLKTAETINQTLKTELDAIRNSVKYIKDNELDPNREVMYEDEIYSASERNYETHTYKDYISLLVKDYEFTCYDGSLLKRLRSYVFNVSNGKMLLNNDLLDMYDAEMTDIKTQVRDKLINDQSYDEEGNEVIKIEETISGLDNPDNYALYIDKYGDLFISYIVKTNQVDYNESMKLN